MLDRFTVDIALSSYCALVPFTISAAATRTHRAGSSQHRSAEAVHLHHRDPHAVDRPLPRAGAMWSRCSLHPCGRSLNSHCGEARGAPRSLYVMTELCRPHAYVCLKKHLDRRSWSPLYSCSAVVILRLYTDMWIDVCVCAQILRWRRARWPRYVSTAQAISKIDYHTRC